MLRSFSSRLIQAARVQECFSPLKTRGGFLQLSFPKSAPSTLICPVILCQLWLNWPVMQTLMQYQPVWSLWLTYTLTHMHAYGQTKLINTETNAVSHSPWCCRTFSLIDAGWSNPLNNSGATDVSDRKCHWYPMPFLVLSTSPMIKQYIWVIEALHIESPPLLEYLFVCILII